MRCIIPDSLTEQCIHYIVENSATVANVIDQLELLPRFDRMTLPVSLVDRLLLKFSERKKLDDASLLFLMGRTKLPSSTPLSSSSSSSTILECVRLPDCAQVTNRGLHGLRDVRIGRLEAIGIGSRANVDDFLLDCLGRSTIQGLSALNVSWSKHLRQPFKFTKRQLAICGLNNLRALNVSHTQLENKGLVDIVENLQLLESLNISATKVTNISPLRRCRDRLQSLRMYNLRDCDDDVSMPVLADLGKLRLLDVSIERPDCRRMFVSETRYRANELIKHDSKQPTLPYLEVLDISGRKDITLENLKGFLECHRKIKFLGLMQTELCSCQEAFGNFKNLKVTGNFTCEQVETSLMCYKDRPQFIEESMEFLYRESMTNPNIYKPSIDIMSFVLPTLLLYPKRISLLLSTTGFISNVLANDLSKVNPKLLSKIVDNLMVAMENYPTHIKLQENTLAALNNESIYATNVNFDYRKCGRLVMNSFKHFNISDFQTLCLNICWLASRTLFMKGSSNSLMPSREEIKKMVEILRRRVEQGIFDDALRTVLKAFANLTCNTPENGLLFLEEGGMDVFYNILHAIPDKVDMIKFLLPTTHSIALFENLRPHLAKEHIIQKLREQLWSDDFVIVFHIAGDLTLLAMEDTKAWRTMKPGAREDTLDDVFKRLQTLVAPNQLPFMLRSFEPGYIMLNPELQYQSHLWILYSIYIFCTSNSAFYCNKLVADGGHLLLKTLMEKENVHPVILKYCQDIFQIVRREVYLSDMHISSI